MSNTDFKCFKCGAAISEVINNESFSAPKTENTLYICEKCVKIHSDSVVASSQQRPPANACVPVTQNY